MKPSFRLCSSRPISTTSQDSWISLPQLLLGFSLLTGLGVTFFVEQTRFPPCCDADYYLELAQHYLTAGVFTKEPLRTFVYPLGLSVLLRIGNAISVPVIVLVFSAQMFIHYLAIFALVRVIAAYSSRLAVVLYMIFCTNIFVIPYAGVTLTDSLYTSLALLIFAWMLKMDVSIFAAKPIRPAWIFSGVFLLSLSVVTRPAAIWLAVPVLYVLALHIARTEVRVHTLVLSLIVGAVPLYVQMTINAVNYQVVTPFPVADLQKQQVEGGIQNIKYGTWMGGGIPNNSYASKGLIEIDASEPLDPDWYFRNPVQASKLVALKLVGAFDFDYLVPYPYRHPKWKWLPSLISFSILWMGIFGMVLHLCTGKLTVLGSRPTPIIIFISWGVVTLVSALELRFTLPLLCYLIIVSGALIKYLHESVNRYLLVIFAASWIFTMPVLIMLAKLIRLQSNVQG
jgi:hypothetical protein